MAKEKDFPFGKPLKRVERSDELGQPPDGWEMNPPVNSEGTFDGKDHQ
jgi:hypothetical protein